MTEKKITVTVDKEGKDFLSSRGYQGFERLDSGGQGNVYKTQKQNKTYACKVVQIGASGRMEDDLMREIQILKNLKSPNCIRVEDMFRTKTKVYLMMDFMPHKTIGHYIRKSNGLCEWKSKSWFCPIARAVKYLHENNISHRDIKSDNILLDQYFNPILTDFGFSLFVKTDPNTRAVEKSNTFCGTLSYYAPELLRKKPYDPFKTDVWSLGITLFVMLNKDYPFDRHDRKAMLEKQVNKDYKFRSDINEALSQDVKDLIKKILEPDPEKRISIKQVCNDDWFPIDSKDEKI